MLSLLAQVISRGSLSAMNMSVNVFQIPEMLLVLFQSGLLLLGFGLFVCLFFTEDGSLGLYRDFFCGFAEDCTICSDFLKSLGLTR